VGTIQEADQPVFQPSCLIGYVGGTAVDRIGELSRFIRILRNSGNSP
jgi:hypothetical protein